jgi:hypothetical protein
MKERSKSKPQPDKDIPKLNLLPNPTPSSPSKSNEYHMFQIRESYMDVLIDQTKLNKSEFKGFYNLIMSLLILYVFTLPILNYLNHGYLVKTKFIKKMVHDLSILIIVWPLFHLWTYLAYILQIMILKNYPKIFCLIFQNLTQAGIFIFTTYICLYSNMCTSHVLFTLTQCLIHFFKMHSYTQTNRDYRENFLMNLKFGEKKISSYPENINFTNFLYFLRAPTFVYQESYPRNENFRISYVILKFLKAIFCVVICYYIYTEHIESSIDIMLETSVFELVARLYFPIFIVCFSLFYLIFECVLPAYAELARFGDRQFYDDWWNSTDLEEFNRRWNKIVHMFLYKHVYLECTKTYKMSPNSAKMVTFLFSALLHEYVLCVVIKLFRPFMFVLMMLQIPLIYFGKKYLKNTTGGNYFVWFSMIIGNCLIFIFYNSAFLYAYGHHY